MRSLAIILLIMSGLCGCSGTERTPFEINRTWDEIAKEAHGQEVTFMMWQGDPFINSYIQNYIKPNLFKKYGINLQVISGQGNVIVNTLRTELEAEAESSQIDMMWINGETFYQLKELQALYGPFTDRLPNFKWVDITNPFIGIDFQQPIEGFECPWGNVQMVWIYDSLVTARPLPENLSDLLNWCKTNPGRFTVSTEFTGLTLLKSFLYEIAGGKDELKGPFDEEKYNALRSQLWKYLSDLRPYMWREGQDFPSTLSQMHQLFASGQIAFTFSNNDSEVDNKVRQGVFPQSARAYVPEIGAIQNSHYLGISSLSSNKAGALVTINYMISAKAQAEKMKPNIWGDGTVLDSEAMTDDERKYFTNIPPRKYAPSRQSLNNKALQEPDSQYMIRLYEDFRRFIDSK